MIVETKLTFKKYLRLMYIVTYKQPIIIFITFIGWVMLIISGLYFLGNNPLALSEPTYYQVAFGFFLAVFLPVSIYFTTKRNFTSNQRLHEKIIYEFTDDKIKTTGETFTSEMTWEKTHRVVELKNWILIYQNKAVANVIPKEVFGNELSAFKEIVVSKAIKNNFFSPSSKVGTILIIVIPVILLILNFIPFKGQLPAHKTTAASDSICSMKRLWAATPGYDDTKKYLEVDSADEVTFSGKVIRAGVNTNGNDCDSTFEFIVAPSERIQAENFSTGAIKHAIRDTIIHCEIVSACASGNNNIYNQCSCDQPQMPQPGDSVEVTGKLIIDLQHDKQSTPFQLHPVEYIINYTRGR